jgi:hypothetical protein
MKEVYYLLSYKPYSIRSSGPDWGIRFTVCVMVRQPGSYNHVYVMCEYVKLTEEL